MKSLPLAFLDWGRGALFKDSPRAPRIRAIWELKLLRVRYIGEPDTFREGFQEKRLGSRAFANENSNGEAEGAKAKVS